MSISSIGSVILGYADNDVDKAVIKGIKKGNSKKKVRFNTTVTSVKYDGSKFEVVSNDKKNNKLLKENFPFPFQIFLRKKEKNSLEK